MLGVEWKHGMFKKGGYSNKIGYNDGKVLGIIYSTVMVY